MTQPSLIPSHVAIVMDGNGRWAQQRNLSRNKGHQAGVETAKNAVEYCIKKGIKILSLFAFSSENWGRPEEEVNGIMSLFFEALQNKTEDLNDNNVRLRFIGDISILNPKLIHQIDYSAKNTSQNHGLELIIAVNYSGRNDIESAIKHIVNRVLNNEIKSSDINQSVISEALSTMGVPDPDLIIRTSGERRISNFMLWQSAYSELYFTDVLWPDFTEAEFDKALNDYATRQRRFGLTTEQIN